MRILHLLYAAVICGALAAQVPQAFDFQAVARDASGNVLSAQPLSVRLTVHSGSASGAVAYQEIHAVTTSTYGLFSVAVGQGSAVQGAFSAVAWGTSPHFLQVELDPAGGSSYTEMGTTQLLSVPYALHAASVTCPTVSLLGDTVRYGSGCYLIQPGISAANGGCLDLDGDGFYDRPGCGPVDCDDAVAGINPGAVELCGNGVDDDCDGVADNNTDPGAFVEWHPDADGDGFGDGAITISACSAPPGHVPSATDCDDSDANIFPGQGCSLLCSPAEAAWVDLNQAFLYQQADNAWFSCFGAPDPGDCLVAQLTSGGAVPLGASCLQCLADRYNCITANCLAQCVSGGATCQACIASAGCDATFLQCMGVADSDGDGWADGSDCGPNDPAIHPNATETCGDGIDSNCNGLLTEGEFPAWPDLDQDGFGSDEGMVMVCFLSGGQAAINGDCDDTNASISPGLNEIVDGLDNDCDGQLLPGEIDADGDGYIPGFLNGDPWSGAPILGDGDCDDADPSIHPGATEICDGIDNNCDGQIDEGSVCDPCSAPDICTISGQCFFNGQSDPGSPCMVCNTALSTTSWSFKPSGSSCGAGNGCSVFVCDGAGTCVQNFSAAGTACDDGDPNTINDVCDGSGSCAGTIVQQEICDGIDNDGDGLTDAADPSLVLVLCEKQMGVCSGVMKSANLCVGGTWLTCSTSDYQIGSPVYETTDASCDGLDNDCDGLVDEDCGQ